LPQLPEQSKTWQGLIYEHDEAFDLENFKQFRRNLLKKQAKLIRQKEILGENSGTDPMNDQE